MAIPMNCGHTCLSTDDFRGKRIIVMGLGRFGGGIGVIRYLVGRGARVLVTDQAAADTLGASLVKLAGLSVEYRLGEHRESDLAGADLLVISPAVDRRTSRFFHAAQARGVPWTTEMNLFLARCPARIVGVTGSIGKSTTCAMTHVILKHPQALEQLGARRALLGGNIGASLLESLDEITAADLVVLELSSFQLECVTDVKFEVASAGLTNVRPHHLDRHGTFDAYFDAKLNLLRALRRGGAAVAGTDDPKVVARARSIVEQRGARLIDATYPGEAGGVASGAGQAPVYALRVPGRHNQANAHMACRLSVSLGVSERVVRQALAEFAGLPHRLEFVAEIDDVRYYNDSKATSAEAVTTAIAAFDGPLVVLLGGKDIGDELDRVTDADWGRVRTAITFGESAARLAALLKSRKSDRPAPVVDSVATVQEAVVQAHHRARAGDVVVLTPGCPSYDAFVNYEARGASFIEAVRALPARRSG